jgi:TRAP-type C4-dicarboxylate transport system substrate-binding protein
MKRVLHAVLLLGALLGVNQSHASTFKIATLAPDGTSWMNEMRAGAEEIQKRTDGRVVFRFYPGGIMGNDKSVLRKIRINQLQGGAITGGGLAEILPEAQMYNLPFLFRDFDEVDYVRSKMDPVLLSDLKKAGYVGFGISEGGFAYLMSNTPVAGIADLKDHKVWVPEGDVISRTAFEATGISPISLPLTDVLTGLQTGLIDTVAATPTGSIALQWHTRVKYLTDTPLMYIYGTLVLKRRAFEKLSAADQKAVHQVMSNIFKRLNEQNRKDNESAMAALKNQGIEFVPADPEGMKSWRKRVEDAMDKLVQDQLFEPALYEKLRKTIDIYRAKKSKH